MNLQVIREFKKDLNKAKSLDKRWEIATVFEEYLKDEIKTEKNKLDKEILKEELTEIEVYKDNMVEKDE